jgi:hypothetical protein
MDWLSRLFGMMPVRGRLDLAPLLRCGLADRAGAARGERNPVPRGRRWLGAVGRPG